MAQAVSYQSMFWLCMFSDIVYQGHVYYIIQDVGPEGLILGLKLNFVTQFTYVFALTFTKVESLKKTSCADANCC